MRSIFSKLFSKSKIVATETSTALLDYEKMIHLDAKDLAEQGMADAYQRLLPELSKFVAPPPR